VLFFRFAFLIKVVFVKAEMCAFGGGAHELFRLVTIKDIGQHKL
jgi:hypothetical protein